MGHPSFPPVSAGEPNGTYISMPNVLLVGSIPEGLASPPGEMEEWECAAAWCACVGLPHGGKAKLQLRRGQRCMALLLIAGCSCCGVVPALHGAHAACQHTAAASQRCCCCATVTQLPLKRRLRPHPPMPQPRRAWLQRLLFLPGPCGLRHHRAQLLCRGPAGLPPLRAAPAGRRAARVGTAAQGLQEGVGRQRHLRCVGGRMYTELSAWV